VLNEEQILVVNHTWGPALVLAGPGSGKTRTVVHRAARLMGEGVPPGEIALVTFTKKAAGEMRERLERLVGEEAAGEVWVSTFHALAAAVLRDAWGRVKVLDAEAARERIGSFLQDLSAPYRVTAKAVQGAISRAKNAGMGKAELSGLYADLEPYLSQVYDLYEAWKEEEGYLDFDDLIPAAVEALKEEEVLKRWRRRTRFLTVDEYQDTNLQQFRLVRALLGPEENLMAVGDPNQAIYSWRGADFRLILEFRRHFPQAQVYRLSTSYRSHGGILQAAVEVIRRNREREDLPLRALREGELPLKVTAEDRNGEALFVGEAVRWELDGGTPPGEVVVLMRSLSQSRLIEAALSRYGVRYTVVGGVGFWARREVRFLLDLLRASYGDKEAFVRAVAQSVPGFGPKRAREAAENPGLLRGKGEEFLQVVDWAKELHGYHGYGLAAAFGSFLNRAKPFLQPLILDWAEGVLEAAEERWRNLEEVGSALRGFAENTPKGTLDLFLQDILLSGEEPREAEGEAGGVRLMTLHASKGMEFHTVFIVGLVEGSFPSWASARRPETLEEERRLFYVGLTRAKERLYLTSYQVGEKGPVQPSRFLGETPGRVLRYDPKVGFHGADLTDTANALADIAAGLDW